MLDKSKGYSFTVDRPWLDHPVDFYKGLYSTGSHAGEYKGELIYLSGVGCRTFKGTLEQYASLVLYEKIIN